jgi:membrane-bound metal-dependent hydrolase YbcI (DUF457 family)
MRTPTHHLFGVVTALALIHWAPPVTGATATAAYIATATATAGGKLSCDVDNQSWWKTLDRWLPDEILGNGGPMQHRGLAHWWGIPAALAVAVYLGRFPAELAPVALGVVTGWGSHIAGDLMFGRGNARYGLKRGVPLLPWGWHVGLGLKADGWTEHAVNALLLPAAGWLALTIGGVL